MAELVKTLLDIAEPIPIWTWGVVALFTLYLASIRYAQNTQMVCRFGAWQRLRMLAKIKDARKKFIYLKQTHHFVFEEMILTAFKRKGYKIVRNKAYTGDGGIDGKVYIKGHLYLIQAKRYSGHIDAGHVDEFATVCVKHQAKGLFIHTGKTGKKARNNANHHNIKMVSGAKLLDLLSSRPTPK